MTPMWGGTAPPTHGVCKPRTTSGLSINDLRDDEGYGLNTRDAMNEVSFFFRSRGGRVL